MKTIHLSQKEHEWETCGICFGYEGDLSRHIKTINLNQKEHKCGTCEPEGT
jgi:hypothetical protein